MIKNTIYNIFAPYIEAFKVSYNILKSGEFEEISITYNFLEVPVESSKHQCNANINPIIDRVLKSKYADGLVYLWQISLDHKKCTQSENYSSS
ncbi:unnamed protein product [Rhizophagus irregularis]|uniref:Uncharacterized protein n=1 Tax=Rhizophagus irregularis TaxID=588596 RepID=A0A916EEN7_9GLOM|nr:unnamed protein product [Rhizophagus irregularis]